IPSGSAHLPPDRIASNATGAPPDRQPYLEEALGWLREDAASSPALPVRASSAEPAASSGGQRILLVEDNRDMRLYLKRLLSEASYAVESAGDGLAAIEAVATVSPDLILSDVMLPRLDGVNMLRRLRRDGSLNDVPIILLSARAGEDFRLEGLEAGADDYLIK